MCIRDRSSSFPGDKYFGIPSEKSWLDICSYLFLECTYDDRCTKFVWYQQSRSFPRLSFKKPHCSNRQRHDSYFSLNHFGRIFSISSRLCTLKATMGLPRNDLEKFLIKSTIFKHRIEHFWKFKSCALYGRPHTIPEWSGFKRADELVILKVPCHQMNQVRDWNGY